MKTYEIRDSRSQSKVKPKICDAIVRDNGEIELEVKLNKGKRTITLKDFKEQIRKIESEIV